jgi:predicted RNase H-like nuclease (RuvC/YqgF family)
VEIQAEIAAIRSQIDALQEERASLAINDVVITNENSSPRAIAIAYRHHARETAQISTEIKGIDDAIAALKAQLQNKQAQLEPFSRVQQQLSKQEQLESARSLAQIHAERINQLAGELADEIRILKACADRISPMYWQVYYKPFITGFKTISVPHVRSDSEVWTIVNRIV